MAMRRHHAKGQIHAAAAEIRHQVQGRPGGLSRRAEGVDGAGQAKIVQIMPGQMRQRAFLSPAGHASEDKFRIAPKAVIGAKAKPLHHAGAKPFDQHVGGLDQTPEGGAIGVFLQVQRDPGPPPVVVVKLRRHRDRGARRRPLHPDDVGAEIGQQHRGERAGADPGHLHHFQALQRSRPRACWFAHRRLPRFGQ